MSTPFFLVAIAIVACAMVRTDNAAADADVESGRHGNIWAVLIAGSKGFWNYRHQADVCHAYHTLVNHGVKPEHIITMMYDDVANDPENNHPGKLYNHPNGSDVYAGVHIDYRGDEVSTKNFDAVLTGDSVASGGKKVLKSTKKDKVFVYFTDHGGVGIIGFPNEYYTVEQLTDTLQKMHANHMYNELLFYMEACESGSMFDQNTTQQLNIFALTAANAEQSSWACYCDNDIVPSTCLGDLFSVNWMEDSDEENLNRETLNKQYAIVKEETAAGGYEGEGSEVLKFGNLRIGRERVSEFMGSKKVPKMAEIKSSPRDFKMVNSRDVPLLGMSTEQRRSALAKRAFLDEQIEEIVHQIMEHPADRKFVLSSHPKGVSQRECHHQVVHTFNEHCFDLAKNPYALKHMRVLANLCEHNEGAVGAERITGVLKAHCGTLAIRNGKMGVAGIV